MLAIWVKVRIKPERRQRFLRAIEVDALGSDRDEPGNQPFEERESSPDGGRWDDLERRGRSP